MTNEEKEAEKKAKQAVTVAELIARLQSQPPDSLVYIDGDDLWRCIRFKHYTYGIQVAGK